LARVAELLDDGEPELAEVKTGLAAACSELRELGLGIHPATLTSTGLRAALIELAVRSPVPVNLTASAERWPPAVEAAAYFICSEALANIAKHANASNVQIQITDTAPDLRIEVADDGVGGANPAMGSGLRGLQDRAEALGGHFAISSSPGNGTRLTAQIPPGAPPRHVGPAPSAPSPEASPSADRRSRGDQPGSAFAGGGQRLLR
jgi:signal transduction histidine kinase